MRGGSLSSRVLAILLALFGLAAIIPALLPYPALQSFLNALSPDGRFNSLRPWNAGIFNLLFAAGGIVLLSFAALTYFRRWRPIRLFLRDLGRDTGNFFHSLLPQKKEAGFLAAVAFLMVLAVIFRMLRAEGPMKYDEAYTYSLFGRSLFSALSDYHLPNNHVFHSVLVFLSTSIFGAAPWAVRLPAMTAGVLLVPAVYGLAKRLYDRWTALAAAALVAWSPALIGYSNNARGYTLVALFTLLILALGHLVLREKNRFAWLLMAVFSALGLWTVPVMLFPFGILFVWLFLESVARDVEIGPNGYHDRREFLLYWLLCAAVAAGLTLLLYLPVLVYSGPHLLFSNDFVAPLAWGDLIDGLSHRFAETWAEWTFRIPVLYIMVVLVGWALGWGFHRRLSKIKIPLQLASLFWIIALLLIQRPNAYSKVWVFLQPLMLMWAAAGLFGLLQKVRPRFLRGLPLSLPVFGIILLTGLWQTIRLIPQMPDVWAYRGEEERTVLLVQQQLQPDEAIVVAPVLDAPIWYYSELHGLPDACFASSRTDAQRLIVLVHLSEDQTLDYVLEDRGFNPHDVDTGAAKLLGSFSSIQVFEVQRK